MRDLDFHPPILSSVGVEKSKKKVGKAVGVAMRRGERGGGLLLPDGARRRGRKIVPHDGVWT